MSAEYSLAELYRLLRNLVRMGRIAQVDTDSARVKVASGGLLSAWIPWCEQAGNARSWNAPCVGQQVVMLAPGGELEGAVIVGSVYSNEFAAPFSDGDVHGIEYADGCVLKYDRGSKVVSVLPPEGSKVVMVSNVEITGNFKLTGNFDSTGTMKNNNKNVGSTHTHNYNPGGGSPTPSQPPNT